MEKLPITSSQFNSSSDYGATAGFSLLEVLLALVIVSIALGVLFQIVSGSLKLEVRAREYYVATSDALEIFRDVVPEKIVWKDLEWSNSTESYAWSLTVHPVALADSFKDSDLTSDFDLIKLVFEYEDRASGRITRLFACRQVPVGSLRLFLKENEDHVVWDEFDQFVEFVQP